MSRMTDKLITGMIYASVIATVAMTFHMIVVFYEYSDLILGK